MRNTKDGRNRTRKIIQRILVSVLLAIAVGGAVMVFCLVGESGLWGYQARIVMSSSMEKSPGTYVDHYAIRDISAGSLILIQRVPREKDARDAFYADLKAGDVLTFSYQIIGGSTVITHRILRIERRDGGYTIVLGGDNGAHVGTQTIDTADAQSPNRVIGKVVWKNRLLGALFCTLRQPQWVVVLCAFALAAMFLSTRKRKGGPPSRRPSARREL